MKDKKLREYLGLDEIYSGFYTYRYKGRIGLIEQIEDKINKMRSNINNLKLENKLLRDSIKELEWRIRYLEGE